MCYMDTLGSKLLRERLGDSSHGKLTRREGGSLRRSLQPSRSTGENQRRRILRRFPGSLQEEWYNSLAEDERTTPGCSRQLGQCVKGALGVKALFGQGRQPRVTYPFDSHPPSISFSDSSRKGFLAKPPPTLYTAAANGASPISFLSCSKAAFTLPASEVSALMPKLFPPAALIS